MAKVLIVDDSPVDRQLAGRLLEKETDLTPVYATGGKDALAAIDRENPEIVVTDLQMPDMTGLELVMDIQARHPGLPVILMTGQGSEEIAVQALRNGAA